MGACGATRRAHKHDEMVTRYRGIWFDYHVESLRRAAAGG